MADHFGDPDNILTDHPEIHRSIFVIAVRLCIVLRRLIRNNNQRRQVLTSDTADAKILPPWTNEISLPAKYVVNKPGFFSPENFEIS